ncbi:MAG: type II secretion system F family protein [Phenylobacterium sp.]|uniref:type II secretion system F family protein n=1 Tax=Phenylobacterium sp. TaxID=1871053 RepID=UPI003919CF20
MDPTLLTLLVAVLGFVAVAGFGFVLVGVNPSQARTQKRTQAVIGRNEAREVKSRRGQSSAQEQRRKQILKTLREEERKSKKARFNIAARMQQAGLGDNVRVFWMMSAGLGAAVVLILLVIGQSAPVAFGLGFASALGLPRWVVGFLANRRTKKFTEAFPDALDIITRGIKSGLPVHDSLRVIAQETAEPLAGEFKRLTENLALGMSMDQSLDNMYERMPTAELRFFGIVLSIQSKTGGNLAEALANLSSVIRARKLMREKIKALSGEAVASAFIIGSLPPGVVMLISMTSPAYMLPMFTDPRGKLMLAAGGVWMAIGIFVMRRMINFKI